MGLTSTVIPVEEWSKLSTAKQLFDLVGLDSDHFFEDEAEDDVDGINDVFDLNDFNDLKELARDQNNETSPVSVKEIEARANEFVVSGKM